MESQTSGWNPDSVVWAITPRTGSGVTTTTGGRAESPPHPASATTSAPVAATRATPSRPLLIDGPPPSDSRAEPPRAQRLYGMRRRQQDGVTPVMMCRALPRRHPRIATRAFLVLGLSLLRVGARRWRCRVGDPGIAAHPGLADHRAPGSRLRRRREVRPRLCLLQAAGCARPGACLLPGAAARRTGSTSICRAHRPASRVSCHGPRRA